MVVPPAGAVVLVAFQSRELARTRLRPSVVLANAGRDDWILCQVTSKPYGDPRAVTLTRRSFRSGGLRAPGCARPAVLFTAHASVIVRQVALLAPAVHRRIVRAIVEALEDARA